MLKIGKLYRAKTSIFYCFKKGNLGKYNSFVKNYITTNDIVLILESIHIQEMSSIYIDYIILFKNQIICIKQYNFSGPADNMFEEVEM
jgi:hypothetical protein